MRGNSKPGPIVVIGSINLDLACRTDRHPAPGETILGRDFVAVPGGKGANQAVAAARLARKNCAVHMIGRVGDDEFGARLLDGLQREGVRCEHVRVSKSAASGVAMIVVDRAGENSIVVTPGANATLSPRDIDAADALIRSASAVVLQLEVPLATVEHAIALCKRHGVFAILDPAPALPNLPGSILRVDLLTPNQSEAEILLMGGRRSRGRANAPLKKSARNRLPDPKQTAADLLSRSGAGAVLLKLGRRGSLLASRDGALTTGKPFKVNVVDTTAAGDAFTAAIAVAHGEKMSWPAALRFANAAGALACEGFGAQSALPRRADVDRLTGTAS